MRPLPAEMLLTITDHLARDENNQRDVENMAVVFPHLARDVVRLALRHASATLKVHTQPYFDGFVALVARGGTQLNSRITRLFLDLRHLSLPVPDALPAAPGAGVLPTLIGHGLQELSLNFPSGFAEDVELQERLRTLFRALGAQSRLRMLHVDTTLTCGGNDCTILTEDWQKAFLNALAQCVAQGGMFPAHKLVGDVCCPLSHHPGSLGLAHISAGARLARLAEDAFHSVQNVVVLDGGTGLRWDIEAATHKLYFAVACTGS
ncbi:hypothetical protein C8Q79DRAFT_431472 [Trametes meyenii]|nr:hypothetical protein C8Q79DRAFT_431472 [Trametes meyenii]